MLDQNYIHQIQTALTKHYRDDISNHDEHHVTIYTNPDSDDALITYHPYDLDDPADNNGKVMPIRDVMIHAIAQHGQWTQLVNQQFIQCHPVPDQHRYLLNFNFRRDNAISPDNQKRLSHDLAAFQVKMTPTGLLIAKINDSFIQTFASMIKAIQFINNNGYNYVTPFKSASTTD